MSWRALVLVPYLVLAAVVASSHGGQGLATLLFFYFVAGAWFAFLLAWSTFARDAGRRHAGRVWRTGTWTFRRGG